MGDSVRGGVLMTSTRSRRSGGTLGDRSDEEEECGCEVGNRRAERRTRSMSSVPASRLAERCRSRTPSCLGATPCRVVAVDTLDSGSRDRILPVSASGDPATGDALAAAASLSLSLRTVRSWGATASAAHFICGRAAPRLCQSCKSS